MVSSLVFYGGRKTPNGAGMGPEVEWALRLPEVLSSNAGVSQVDLHAWSNAGNVASPLPPY